MIFSPRPSSATNRLRRRIGATPLGSAPRLKRANPWELSLWIDGSEVLRRIIEKERTRTITTGDQP